MDISLFGQYLINGLVLGVIYSMVAVGFTLFFGVLDVIKFSHGDVLMGGAFTALSCYLIFDLQTSGVSPSVTLFIIIIAATMGMALVGAAIAHFLVMPLRSAPPLNTLLVTLMFGLALRETVRLFFPNGSNPKPFPSLLTQEEILIGQVTLRMDSVIIVMTGLGSIMLLHLFIVSTRFGLAIRAVAQDTEVASLMGINFRNVVLGTFALGSALAALAGVANGLYYNEINFSMGLLLGVIGFSSAIVGGLGSILGAILGGFIFALLQTIGAVWFAVPAYKDVFAFAMVIAIMAWRPTGLISEKETERV